MNATQEAAQDFRALITHMTDAQIMTFLDNTVRNAGADRLEVTKLARKVGDTIVEEFTLSLVYATDENDA